jgi:hypothetical protein
MFLGRVPAIWKETTRYVTMEQVYKRREKIQKCWQGKLTSTHAHTGMEGQGAV